MRTVKALLALAAGAWHLSAASHTITPADIANLKRVSDCQISPDGKEVAWVVETPVKAGEQKNAHIWLSSVPGRPYVASNKSDTSPRWSPDGRTLAFLSDREKGEEQVWAIALEGGEAYPLTSEAGGVKRFKWSRDGKSLLLIRADVDTPEQKARKEAKNDEIWVDHDYKYDRLWIVDVASRKLRQVTTENLNVDDFDPSPDGRQAIVRVSPTPVLNDYWYDSKVGVLDLETGRMVRTLSGNASPQEVHWAAQADMVTYGEKTKRGIADVPVVMDVRSGARVEVARDGLFTLHDLTFDADGQHLTAQGVEGTRAFFARVNARTGECTKLADVPANSYSFTASDDGQTLAYVGNTAASPDDAWMWSKENGAKRLAESNPQVSDWQLGRVSEMQWKSSKDGRRIYGVLILPPDYQQGKRYKTIVHAHGGPFEAWLSGWLGTWYEWSQLLASNGYVVLAPNPRGSQGQGSAFQEANYRDWGGGDYQDVMDGVDTLVREGIADPDHLGIGGWSYGGFMTAWTVTHTDRFKAAVVGAAVTDLPGMSTTTDIAPAFLQEFFGEFPADRKLYEDHSPMRFIANCHTPALVLHGDSDVRVPTFQGVEFYKALRLMGRQAELVRYPREPHIFQEREHQTDMLERILRFFGDRL